MFSGELVTLGPIQRQYLPHYVEWLNDWDIGIFIGDKNYWSKGYGTDATRTLLRFAFGEANLHRVELEVFAFNPRAIRMYEKVGFKLEGIRQQALFREGAWHDEHIMAILQEEWIALNR